MQHTVVAPVGATPPDACGADETPGHVPDVMTGAYETLAGVGISVPTGYGPHTSRVMSAQDAPVQSLPV
jgi:hypothetical protein